MEESRASCALTLKDKALLVSYLIPAFNHERYVVRCLDSILEDQHPRKQIVIIDDGSTDRTDRMIRHWIDRNGGNIEVVYRSRPNRGIAATLNELALTAKGDLLRLGASDDYFLPNGSAILLGYLNGHPEKLAAIGDAEVVDENGATMHASAMADLHGSDKRGYATDVSLRREIIKSWAIGGPVLMVRREVFMRIGGWREELRIDDWCFFLRLVAINALGFIDRPVGAYRLHGNNTSKTRDRGARIANLNDAAGTARRHLALFRGAEQRLLHAELNLLQAKIEYLQRRPVRSGISLGHYIAWCVAARVASEWRGL